MPKYFLMLTKADQRKGDVIGPPEPFSQKCPGGSTFQLVSAQPPIGPDGKVVVIEQSPEKSCLSECEQKFARYTYFRTIRRIEACPLLLAEIESPQITGHTRVPVGRQNKIESARQKEEIVKFDPGRIVVTRGVRNMMANNEDFTRHVDLSLIRHLTGDWGDICDEDRGANDFSLEVGVELLSVYRKEGMPKIWIVTEWDRSHTTILFPEDH